jgi:hypothetical protein
MAPLAACAMFAAAGCETVPLEPSPDFVPDTVVASDYAQFFRLGPQQAGGADRSLRTGDFVMLQRKEFGYSRVQLEDGQVGYMANEDIQPAPPQPKPKPTPRKKGSRQEETFDDTYYENLPIPDPNLNIMPEDVPLEPLPDLLPEPTPVPPPEPTPEPTPVKESLPEKPPEAAPPVSTST